MRRWLAVPSALAATLLALGAAVSPAPAGGAALYGRACAGCHGADGGGGIVPAAYPGLAALRAPPVVGPCALRTFSTGSELLAYVRYDMPLEAPGTLADEDARAVVLYLLERNGIHVAAPLTLARAGAVELAHRGEGADCPRGGAP